MLLLLPLVLGVTSFQGSIAFLNVINTPLQQFRHHQHHQQQEQQEQQRILRLRCSSGSNQEEDDEDLSEESRKRFEEITKRFLSDDATVTDFPSAMPPRNPFQLPNKNNNKGSADNKLSSGKGSLYSDDELMNLLSIHNDISDELNDDDDDDINKSIQEDELNADAKPPLPPPPSSSSLFPLHDLVMQTLNDDDNSSTTTSKSIEEESSSLGVYKLDAKMEQKRSQIRAIASDIDGTILTKKQKIHSRAEMAIQKVIKLTIGKSNDNNDDDNNNDYSSKTSIDYFFPATGKSRKGAIDSLTKASDEIGSLIQNNCAGVYLQGLYCVDQHDNVIFEKKLNVDAISAAESLISETGVSIVAYDGDDLYTTYQSDIVVHLHEHYGEPLPVLLPNDGTGISTSGSDHTRTTMGGSNEVRKLASHAPSMHKLLIMDDDIEKLSKEVRPKLEELAVKYDACVTQAIPTMLELLPNGCSKAIGVEKLCEALSINFKDELMAIGDAENDAGMLKGACIGVAVANACPLAKDVADLILNESNDDGGAGVAIEIFAFNSKDS